jgi:hypothetical protein
MGMPGDSHQGPMPELRDTARTDVMRQWEAIRAARDDLTDFVVHFTRWEYADGQMYQAKDKLIAILRSGAIQPTFAPMSNRRSTTAKPTIQGPDPVVCLTEQPLSAFLNTPQTRYSHYGIAYHKVALFNAGGRPVLYGSENELYALPDSLKYLWVRYEPVFPHRGNDHPVDFTWEREWRFKGALPVLLDTDLRTPTGVIVVEKDADIADINAVREQLAAAGNEWARYLTRVISLETAKRNIAQGDSRYRRIETWPDEPQVP